MGIYHKRSEADEQMVVVRYLKAKYPQALFTISPQGMKLPIRLAAKFKRMGYRAGTPDIQILEPRQGYHGLFIELKMPRGRTTESQREFISELFRRGYKAVVCFGASAACEVIDEYLKPFGSPP
jgi:hypothetical protein